eukprot:10267754-Lingulodinium_polyedra.AAC.1
MLGDPALALRCGRIQRTTLVLYQQAVQGFKAWAAQERRALQPHAALDASVGDFLAVLFDQGRPLQCARHLVYGLQKL